MSFLPVVERELRVAARRPSTYRVRLGAALSAVAIGGILTLASLSNRIGLPTVTLGSTLFMVLSGLSLMASLSAGLFLTSDCLSEEKREGTLGFLFLTDLHAHDVVLGKLAANSFRAFLALLGALPILGMTLLLGSVTGADFWRTSLALINALFFSLVAGVLVSALSRSSQKAMTGTAVLVLGLVAAGEVGQDLLPPGFPRDLGAGLSPLRVALAVPRGDLFWTALAVNQGIAWSMLGAACLILPRSWTDRVATAAAAASTLPHRRIRRERWLDRHPILGLIARDRGVLITLWLIVGGMVVATIGMVASGQKLTSLAWSSIQGAAGLALYLAVSVQACRFNIEARRNGFLELLRVSPLPAWEILRGQWLAWRLRFGWPLLACLLLTGVNAFLSQRISLQQMVAVATAAPPSPATPSTPPVTNSVHVGAGSVSVQISTPGSPVSTLDAEQTRRLRWIPVVNGVGRTVDLVSGLAAVIWFGLWTGVRARTPHLGALRTLAFVQVIPELAILFALALLTPLVVLPLLNSVTQPSSTSMWFWIPVFFPIAGMALALTKNLAFVAWSRRQLRTHWGRDSEVPPSGPPPRLG